MPRGRNKGSINRKPGIFGQIVEKVRNEEGKIDRNRLNVTIMYNDKEGNRYNRLFEVCMNKEGSGVYIPQGANGGHTPELVSKAPVEETPVAETPALETASV